jgi:hypothetical protein
MSIIDELNEQYLRYDAAMTLQHNLLAKSLGALSAGFASYLGLEKAYWHHEDGKKGDRYVRLGVGAPEAFEEKIWPQFNSLGGIIHFPLAVTLEAEDATYKRYNFVFEGSAQFVPEGYQYQFKGVDQPVVLPAHEVEEEDFRELYKVLIEQLKRKIDPDSILIAKSK